jgi:hypothetical protein
MGQYFAIGSGALTIEAQGPGTQLTVEQTLTGEET